jgi:hypothetical protein
LEVVLYVATGFVVRDLDGRTPVALGRPNWRRGREKIGEWPVYSADNRSTKLAARQIDKDNV